VIRLGPCVTVRRNPHQIPNLEGASEKETAHEGSRLHQQNNRHSSVTDVRLEDRTSTVSCTQELPHYSWHRRKFGIRQSAFSKARPLTKSPLRLTLYRNLVDFEARHLTFVLAPSAPAKVEFTIRFAPKHLTTAFQAHPFYGLMSPWVI
jgi:hypothetical protein